MSTLVVAWSAEGGRSAVLAPALGAEAFFTGTNSSRSLLGTYAVRSFETIRHIRRTQPSVVIVQNPPIFAVIACFIGSRLVRGSLLIDAHTGAFVDPKWRRFEPIHRWLARRSAGLIVHNRSQARHVAQWGANVVTAAHTPIEPIDISTAPTPKSWVLVAASGAADEPLDAVRLAASSIPDIRIIMTGDRAKVSARLAGDCPANLELTGFVDHERYLQLLDGASVVVALTTREQTLLSGGFEALAFDKPLVTSNTTELVDYFAGAALHSGDDPEELATLISQAWHNPSHLASERADLARREADAFEQLRALVARLNEDR